jgi:hypothetical protein
MPICGVEDLIISQPQARCGGYQNVNCRLTIDNNYLKTETVSIKYILWYSLGFSI